jgi:ABC-2 type transport system permease protein
VNTVQFKDIWQIAQKDLTEFYRSKIAIIAALMMPIFMMLLIGFIFPSQNSLKNVPIGIYNQDKQVVGNNFVKELKDLVIDGNHTFIVHNYTSLQAMKEGIKKQDVNGGVIIPKDLTKRAAANKQTELIIIRDQSNPQIAAMTSTALTKAAEGFGGVLGAKKVETILLEKSKIPSSDKNIAVSALALTAPLKTRLEGVVPGNPNYFEFLAPGIMMMVVITALLTGLAGAVAKENEQGTIDGILIAPITRLSIILGKALAQSIRGFIQGFIVLLIAVTVFGVTIHGSFFLVALLLFLCIFSFVGLGILVSASVAEQEAATQLLFMLQLPVLFLSGAFFPLQQMPLMMQNIAHALPLTYAVEALRKVIVLGAGFNAVKGEILILVIFGVVTLAIAVPLFKKMVVK